MLPEEILGLLDKFSDLQRDIKHLQTLKEKQELHHGNTMEWLKSTIQFTCDVCNFTRSTFKPHHLVGECENSIYIFAYSDYSQ
jgi:hypothetical protein